MSRVHIAGDVIRISQVDGDIAVIQAVWGPSQNDTRYTYKVRGVSVSRTSATKEEKGRMYRMYVFPNHAWQWVNEGNVRGFKNG